MRLAIALLIPLALACGNEAKHPDAGPDGPARTCDPFPPLFVSRYCAAPWFPGEVTLPGSTWANGYDRFALGDLDGDGRLDAVAAGQSNAVYTFLGSNHGVWATPVRYAAQPDTADLALGDLDGNGSLDVAVVSWPIGGPMGRVDVWLNNGSGALVPGPSLTTDTRSTRVIVADANADGRQDIIVPTATRVQIFHNQGNATFGAPLSYATGTDVYAYPDSVAVADVNGDGRIDIVASYWGGDVYVLAGRANGFGAATHYNLGLDALTTVVRDVTGDGKVDLIGAGRTAQGQINEVAVLANTGMGAFSTPTWYAVADYFGDGLAIADIDGDGDQDVMISVSGGVSVMRNAGDGTLGFPQPHGVGSARELAVADIDGDGKLDLAIYSAGLYTILGGGDGTFIEGLPGPNAGASVVVDVNHDGFADLVGRSSDPTEITVTLSNGDGTFGSPHGYDIGAPSFSPAVADIDGDGNFDVLVAASIDGVRLAGKLIVMRGRGDGSFAQAETYPAATPGTESLAVGDLNTDCMPDVVLANSGVTIVDKYGNVIEHHDGSADVLLNNGDGTFGPPRSFAGTSQSVRLGDINSDGIPEAFLTIADETFLFLPDGSGGFTNTANLGANVGSVIDVNHDDHLDIVRLNAVELGRGNGTFEPPIATDTPYSGSWGDIDGDGNLDGTYLRLFRGHGDGTFTKHDYPFNFGGIADVNGDGYADSISDRILLQRCF